MHIIQAIDFDTYKMRRLKILSISLFKMNFRTPRVELATQVTPNNVGHLLCKYMHDEDNKFGLRVTNNRGNKWIAYGDGMLFEKCNEVYTI